MKKKNQRTSSMPSLSDHNREMLHFKSSLPEHDTLDETIGDMYRTSYLKNCNFLKQIDLKYSLENSDLNPASMTSRADQIKGPNTELELKTKVPKKSPENEAILKAMEKRIDAYLLKQKKQELYGYKTLENWNAKSNNVKLRYRYFAYF